jgi:hypothetical protein
LPTFSKETQIPDQAFLVEVDLDRQVEQVDVRPVTGKLFTLTVSAATIPPNPIRPLPVTITLVSELGRQTVHASTWTFGPLPAGQYDLFSEAPLERGPGLQSDYRRITVSQDTSASFVLHEEPALEFAFPGAPSQAIETGAMRVLARRKDLAGADATHVLELVNNRFQLATGPWQLALEPPSGYYVSAFSGPGHQPPPDLRADCWNDMIVSRGAAGVRFSISGSSALLHGTVKSSGEAVAGAPVFLEPLDLEASRRVTEMLVARTDTQGQYHFTGLAPGNYRILSSFEYLAPDSEDMSNAGAKAINLAANRNLQQDLDLYVVR